MSNIKFVQYGSNFAQCTKKNKRMAKIQSIEYRTQKQKFGATISFPEGLENSFSISAYLSANT